MICSFKLSNNGNKGDRQKVKNPYLMASFVVLIFLPKIKPGYFMLKRNPANVCGNMILPSSTSTI